MKTPQYVPQALTADKLLQIRPFHPVSEGYRVDQGSEFISWDLDLWAYQKDVTLDFPRPGKSTDNAFIKSFNGKFRA